mmetsp:Transcript_4226/g.10809  ORF Transcript_4226/g.10809 Transcript_4226/m.10809 type:complete len:272 (+) Transcript_4226:619-1434(+)
MAERGGLKPTEEGLGEVGASACAGGRSSSETVEGVLVASVAVVGAAAMVVAAVRTMEGAPPGGEFSLSQSRKALGESEKGQRCPRFAWLHLEHLYPRGAPSAVEAPPSADETAQPFTSAPPPATLASCSARSARSRSSRFHRLRTALSVRPGKFFAIRVHLKPCSVTPSRMSWSSCGAHSMNFASAAAPRLRAGTAGASSIGCIMGSMSMGSSDDPSSAVEPAPLALELPFLVPGLFPPGLRVHFRACPSSSVEPFSAEEGRLRPTSCSWV